MARKKKKVNDVSGVATVPIITTGNLKITVSNKNGKVKTIKTHNSDTLSLCQYIRNALVGDYVIAERPGYIIPCKSLGSEGGLEPMFNFGIINSGYKKEEDGLSSVANIIFDIPSSILSPGDTIDGFNLYSNKFTTQVQTLYAQASIVDDPIVVEADTNIRVEWKLVVSFS